MKKRICVAFTVTEVDALLIQSRTLTKRQREQIQRAVGEAKAAGLDVVPPCHNVNKQGLCQGHIIIEENERP